MCPKETTSDRLQANFIQNAPKHHFSQKKNRKIIWVRGCPLPDTFRWGGDTSPHTPLEYPLPVDPGYASVQPTEVIEAGSDVHLYQVMSFRRYYSKIVENDH